MQELPTSHRVPVSWLRAYACSAIKWRTLRDILPPGSATPEDYEAARTEAVQSKQVQQIVKKQRKNGLWGDQGCF